MSGGRLLSSLAFLALLSGSSSLEAAPVKVKKTYYVAFGWQILTPPPMLSEPVWVDEFTSFLDVQIMPKVLYRAEAAVINEEGQEVVPANAELIGLIGEIPGACTTNPQGPVQKGLWVNKIVSTNVCLLDSDKDGRFDQYVPWAGDLVGSFRVPKQRNTLQPTSLKPIDPASFSAPRHVYLQYSYFASWVNILDFQICLNKDVQRSTTASGAGYYVGCLGSGIDAKREPLPSTFEAFGATFSVDAKDGKRVQVRQVTPIQPQPFLIL